MARREFTRAVKVEIVKRATREYPPGTKQQWCEKCGQLCTGFFDIDHRDPDAMQIDKGRKLTADDGWLLCSRRPDSCHAEKTAKDVADIARAKRLEASHLGVKKESSRPMGKKERPPKPKLIVAPGGTQLQRRYRTI